MTAKDEVHFGAGRKCYICDGEFDDGIRSTTKVRDHDHISVEFRGAAHSKCNFRKRQQRDIPVFCQNLREHDEHILIPALGKYKDRKLRIIGQTVEKYMMIELGKHLIFKDTMLFLQTSLATHVSNLVASDRNAFVQLKAGINDDANLGLLHRRVPTPTTT
jgi:hypothetical protein